MGKRILVRRRGKAGLQWLAPKKGKVAPVSYPRLPHTQTVSALVESIFHERGRGAPLARLIMPDGKKFFVPAVAGLAQGGEVMIGPEAPASTGNILPLSRIPEGTTVSNIESVYGDGGRMVRTSGCGAIVFSQAGSTTVVRLPSGKSLFMDSRGRATVGTIASGGRTEKPFLTAGARERYMISRNKSYPTVRGIAMAVVHHPFGGGRHQHPGKSTSTARNTPPGRKVGHIAPRKTGRGRVISRETVEQKR
ncbi:MAG: 50S ribosomal protein L2 [Nitrososphaerota archaeon]|nr:50S ribosomal protein L2 [Nitrososphaerota archaeon]